MTRPIEALEIQGFVWFRKALDDAALNDIEACIGFGSRPGSRPNASPKLMAALSANSPLGTLSGLLMPEGQPVRLAAFNKSPSTNWGVPWHQDRVIAVSEKRELPGFSNWGRRGDCWHVEPPEAVLQNMHFARIHFDDATPDNGAMELAVGSHHLGAIAAARAKIEAERHEIEVCNAERGDVLFVKALTLHRSGTASVPKVRRALRVDYSNAQLPAPLQWAIGA